MLSTFLKSSAKRSFQAKYFGTTLFKNTNQASGLANYAIDFMQMDNSKINQEVYDRVRLFHTDSVICGVSALSLKTNAPNILRNEAIKHYQVNQDTV
jgi:hypothetical protein